MEPVPGTGKEKKGKEKSNHRQIKICLAHSMHKSILSDQVTHLITSKI
jgi:hypothetical protein